jgi:hypothetical protein
MPWALRLGYFGPSVQLFLPLMAPTRIRVGPQTPSLGYPIRVRSAKDAEDIVARVSGAVHKAVVDT